MTTKYVKKEFVTQTKKVYNTTLNEWKEISKVRFICQNVYNFNMNGVDKTDQRRWYLDESGKHVWRMRKWTWSLYKLIIGTRRTQAYCIHEELVRIDQKKWDAKYEARVEELMQPPQRQTRQNRQAPSREVAEMQAHREISSLKYGLGPRP